jgi:hypothetical protein
MKPALLVTALAATMLAATASASANPAVVAPAHGGGMTGGELLGEGWVQALSGRNAPYAGTCTSIARNVLVSHFRDGSATCAARPSSLLFVFFGSFCSTAEPPFPTTEPEQLACAIASDQAIQHLNVTVDGGRPIDIVSPRFEVVSPQRSVLLSPNNEFGLPAGPATFTAHAWAAVLKAPRPGRHTVTVEVVAPDWGGTLTFTTILEVAGGSHPDD